MARFIPKTCRPIWWPGRLAVLALASFLLAGAGASAEGVPNGGFESGTLSGWTLSGLGSAQILDRTSLSSLVPPEGGWYALLGNGPSDLGADGLSDSATLTSSSFIVPMGGGQLSFDWNFLTAEFTGLDADPTRLDRFSVSLLLAGGSSVTLLSGNVADAGPFTYVDAGGAAVATPDGTSVFEHTGFRSSAFSLSEGTYSLAFTVEDDGDGSFDSALAVDHITFRATPVVPEPANGLYALAGLIMVLAYQCALVLRRSGQRAQTGGLQESLTP